MSTTSEQTDRVTRGQREPSPVEPLLHELRRIAGHAETERAAADQALIAELRAEVAALRAAVAHLRAGTGRLPHELRPVVARAMVSVQQPGGGSTATG